MTSKPVRYGFYLRTPAGKGGYHYDPIEVANPSGHMSIETSWPPAVGDLINLLDKNREIPGGPVFRVVDRCWDHEHWKSGQWPEGNASRLSARSSKSS